MRLFRCLYKGSIWLILEMGGSEKFLLYLAQENKSASGRWWSLSWDGERGEGLLLNVNILMKREVFFFPSTNVGVGPVWKEIGKGGFSSVR